MPHEKSSYKLFRSRVFISNCCTAHPHRKQWGIQALNHYYDLLINGQKELSTKDKMLESDGGQIFFSMFSFKHDTKDIDGLLYDDIYNHFPVLKEQLDKCEEFIWHNGTDAEKTMFDLAKFIYKNKEYNKFVERVIKKNPRIAEDAIRRNYFIFAGVLLITSQDDGAKKFVPAVLDWGGAEECMEIIYPYCGSFKPYVQNKEKVKSNNELVEKLWSTYIEAENLFLIAIKDVDIYKHRFTLYGDCDYIK